MATAAEKLENDLRARGKRTNLPLSQMETLLTHPLLEGLVDTGKGGHSYIIRNPYGKCTAQVASQLAEVLELPKLESVIMKTVIPISNHKGSVLFAYVNEVLDFIEVRRLIIDNGLEDLLR